MQSQASDSYLATEVMTAAPQRLQLMLIEAAIRFGQEAIRRWEANQDEEASEALIRCQQIVTELICGLNPDQNPEVVRRVASVYLYIFRTLNSAHLDRSAEKVNDAISVLEVERGTWQQVCEQLGTRRETLNESTPGMSLEI